MLMYRMSLHALIYHCAHHCSTQHLLSETFGSCLFKAPFLRAHSALIGQLIVLCMLILGFSLANYPPSVRCANGF